MINQDVVGVKRHNKRSFVVCSTARATLSAASTGSLADSFSLARSIKSAVSSAARAQPARETPIRRRHSKATTIVERALDRPRTSLQTMT